MASLVKISINLKLESDQVNLRIRRTGIGLIQLKPTHRTNTALPLGEELISIERAIKGFNSNIPFRSGGFALISKAHGWYEIASGTGVKNIEIIVSGETVEYEVPAVAKPINREKRSPTVGDKEHAYRMYGHFEGRLPNGGRVRDQRGPEG